MVHITDFGNLNDHITIFVSFFYVTRSSIHSDILYQPDFLANMPNRFQPDPEFPEGKLWMRLFVHIVFILEFHFQTHLNSMRTETKRNESINTINIMIILLLFVLLAFQYEGLINYDAENIPNATEYWKIPGFAMSTYDAAVVSWRATM